MALAWRFLLWATVLTIVFVICDIAYVVWMLSQQA